ncbi:DUF3520 domain-containing protein [Pseudorhodobacter sp. E13]|uniref:vWA domain-containing protein n=1 Tax=Pseudorhodobacter sp. E13 TaxID=2487931 RepID=UPI000F8CE46E|nr:von Willebrand factor type A domain-containing protein [Pseudorhodobacter sp. E13]RUS60728.1 DUF3520 domain-containing protein [Pseudorhodobacter sp. E13]
MTEDFDKLRDGLRKAPGADPARKEAALRLAMQNFDRAHQGTQPQPRPIPVRPRNAGLFAGVRTMLSRLTTRPILAATTSVAAICLGLIVVLPITPTDLTTPKPLAEVAPAPEATPAPVPATAQEAVADLAAVSDAASDTAGAVNGAVATGQKVPAAPTAPSMTRKRVQDGQMLRRETYLPQPSVAPTPIAPAEIDPGVQTAPDTEAFPQAEANPIKVTAQDPVSTFSVDVDTASYAVVRSSLMQGQLPPDGAVRIEEMVNYFPYTYAAPAVGEAPFKSSVTVMPTPWNPGTQLVRIGLQGRLPAIADRPALNLVFLVDTSGSMQNADKLPLLKQSLRLLLPQLRPEDEVAIVAYAGSAGEVLPPTRAENSAAILDALDRLEAGGSTAGAEGLELAYRLAEKMGAKGEVSRVLLATDGDFNVGVSDPDGLEKFIAKKRAQGTYLSVLGFGRGNLDDAVMQTLAQSGNGMAAYIDTLQEARKVLVDQLSGALFPIADDVKIQVEWNPAQVAEYRLIGYETRALAREDFNNDKVDAGEIGAGHAVTALYEVTAPGSTALANDPLRYGAATPSTDSPELGFLRLRYKAPGETTSALIETPITASDAPADEDARFAAAIAGFGQLLTGAKYLGDWGWQDAIALAQSARGEDAFGYRTEAVNLMRLAQSLSVQ